MVELALGRDRATASSATDARRVLLALAYWPLATAGPSEAKPA